MGQQGQISLFRRFRIPAFGQKFRNILRRKIGVVFQKPFQILFIFLSAKRTGAVNQNAALFHIACRISQNFSLNFCQAVNLIAILFQADIRLLSHQPQTGAGHIRQYTVKLLRAFLLSRRILYLTLHDGNAKAFRALLHQVDFMRINIAGKQTALVFHPFRNRKAFPARRGTHV